MNPKTQNAPAGNRGRSATEHGTDTPKYATRAHHFVALDAWRPCPQVTHFRVTWRGKTGAIIKRYYGSGKEVIDQLDRIEKGGLWPISVEAVRITESRPLRLENGPRAEGDAGWWT